jgi:tyrosine-protein kinase Etk/Wzc
MHHPQRYQQPGVLPLWQYVPPPPPPDPGAERGLSSYLKIIYEQRWLIATVALLVLLAGVGYALLAPQVYEANVLIHVENDSPRESRSFLMEAGSLFSIKTTASAEAELFQSRLVISRAAEKLNLDISGEPDYLPLVGKWLTRFSQTVPAPAWVRARGYAWGGERIDIGALKVPEEFLNRELRMTLEQDGRFQIVEPKSGFAASGRVGERLVVALPAGGFELLINAISAKPGTRFILKHASRQTLIDDILKRMQVTEQGKQSGIIRAALRGEDPVQTSRVLGEIAQAYISQNGSRKTQEADSALVLLEKQLPEIKKQLDTSEARYSQFRNQNSTVDMGEEARIALQQSAALKTRKMELEQKRIDLLTRFTPEHPYVKGVDAQLADVSAESHKLAGHIKVLPLMEQELVRLSRNVKVNTELYTTQLNTMRELRLASATKTSNVRLVDMPLPPDQPVWPNRPRIIGASLLAGLMLGLVSGFLRKSLQKVVDHPDEIEQSLGVPVFAAIPYSKAEAQLPTKANPKSAQMPLLAKVAPTDPAIESLRSFRMVLQYSMSQLPGRVVLFTGTTAGSGKTFVSANLAALLGAGGKRVLLIDGDLRNGQLHRYFGCGCRPGLAEAIAGAAPVEKLIQRELLPGLEFLSAGALPEDVAAPELLMRPQLAALLAGLEAQYDMIVIDSAPLLAVSDPVILGMHASAIYVVTRAGVTTSGEVAESLKHLSQAGLSARGVLFNGVTLHNKQYDYRYRGYQRAEYLSRPPALLSGRRP